MNEPTTDKTSLTDDERIDNIIPLPPPEHLIRFFPIQGSAAEGLIAETRARRAPDPARPRRPPAGGDRAVLDPRPGGGDRVREETESRTTNTQATSSRS